MERARYLLAALLILWGLGGQAQAQSAIYDAYIRGDMGRWKAIIDSLHTASPADNGGMLALVNYMYGYIAWSIDADRRHQARRYMAKANQRLDELWARGFNLPELHAYRAAFIGFEIGLAPVRAPFIGPESVRYAREAVRLNPLNAFGHMQLGNISFHKPPVFGGSKADALGHYLRALAIMERDSRQRHRNWNYLNLLANITNVYIELGQWELARQTALKALAVEPEFDWVRNGLYPRILKRE